MKALSFIVLIGLILVSGVGLSILAWNLAENGKPRTAITEGKVINFVPPTETVAYWVGGVRYEVREWRSNTVVGMSIPVHYDPQNPSNANSGISIPTFFGFLVPIGMLVTLMVFLLSAVFLPHGHHLNKDNH
jgi:hypothetical protein